MVQNENCNGVSHNIMKHQKSHASVHIWIFWDMICKINNKVSETTSFFLHELWTWCNSSSN